MKCNVCNMPVAAEATLAILMFSGVASAQFYKQTNLVSDLEGMSTLTDPQLINPWGVSLSSTSPFWVSDAGTMVSTLYSVDPTTGVVAKVPLTVSIPGRPSGQLFNGSTDFVVSSGGTSGPARFIFAGLNGTISGWNPGVPPPPTSTQAILATTGTAPAVYTGIALATRNSGQFLYAANPAGGRIDVYDSAFTKVTLPGSFTDPNLPAGDAPFNIANIAGSLFVSYSGPTGAINVFDTDGNLVRRFATDGTLLSPWGMAVAPADFGKFSNSLLVGNFNRGNPANGPGHISAFDLSTGEFLGLMKGTDSDPLAVDGLWALIFGNGGSGGNPNVLYFAAGIQNEQHGLFGSLSACHGPVISGASANPNVLWPPNNQFVPVRVDYSVADDCDPAPVCTLSVSSGDRGDEGQDGDEDHHDGHEDDRGSKSQDAIVIDAHTVELLASREGNDNGRIFTISINCKDKLPLSSTVAITVTVPHDQDHDKNGDN